MSASAFTALDVMRAEELLGPHLGGDSFRAWHTYVAAVHGLPAPYEDSLALFQASTGRDAWPTAPAREVLAVMGRRSGKTNTAAAFAIDRCVFRQYDLPPGADPVFMAIAADRRQARVLLRYVRGLLNAVPVLAATIASETAESMTFTTGVRLEVHTASFRAIRGYTVVGAVVDELAFFRTDDSANPDHEILEALRPAMATVPDAVLMMLSSPYAKRGEVYRLFDRYYGKADAPVLVWRAPTRVMNPTVSERTITMAMHRDEASARSEYGAEFRNDLEGYVSRELVDACTDDATSRPPDSRYTYRAFVDPAGGSGQDSFTLAIAHTERVSHVTTHVLDLLIEIRPPFSPDDAVDRFVRHLREYGVTAVSGDRYAGEWARQPFDRRGVRYLLSEQNRSELYLGLLPLLTSGRVRLLRDERLALQLTALERRTSAIGRDTINHPNGLHDDLANVVAGVACGLEQRRSGPVCAFARIEALL